MNYEGKRIFISHIVSFTFQMLCQHFSIFTKFDGNSNIAWLFNTPIFQHFYIRWFCRVIMLSYPPLARRLEKDVKLVLDDICSDPAKKIALITGRQVELAEELSKILIMDSFYFKLSFDQSGKNETYWDG